ncbi:MAG: hypothetical protein AAF658_19195, partial [Myxococcota bacterium]
MDTTVTRLWPEENAWLGVSRLGIAIGSNDGGARELPRVFSLVTVVSTTFVIGVTTLDARALHLLEGFPERLGSVTGRLCPEPGTAVTKKKDDKLGCALVRRAYALGYADSLGDCEESEEIEIEICTLRQSDEPLLHYAWRRLRESSARWTTVGQTTPLQEAVEEFRRNTERIQPLYETQADVLGAAPRAAHHVFTNLPHPGGLIGGTAGELFDPRSCTERYRRLSHRHEPSEDATLESSRAFDHVFGQLLFETRYDDPVGYCPEYVVHWQSPSDVCERLVKDAAIALDDVGARAMTDRVFDRYERERNLSAVRPSLGKNARSRPVQWVLSFQCYMEEERFAPLQRNMDVTYRGKQFTVVELRAPPPPPGRPAERYGLVASLMAPEFQYGLLFSEALNDDDPEAQVSQAFFAEDGGYLSRLGLLSTIDVFLRDNWLLERPDMLE